LAEKKTEEKKVSRRKFIAAGGAVVVAAAAGAAYYLSQPPPAQPGPTTMTRTIMVPTTVAATTGAESPEEKAKRLATAKPGERFLIGNITLSLTNEPGADCSIGAAQACEALGLDYIVRDTGWSSVAPLDAARELVSLGCKGIVSYALDPAVVNNVAKICNDNHIFFTSIYSSQPFYYPWSVGDGFLHFESQDGDTEENVLSTLLFQRLNGEGKVAHIQGTANYAANAEKNFGIWRGWQKYPNIRLVGHQYGQWAPDVAKTVMEQITAANPDVKGAVCINDSMAVGVANANPEAGKNTIGVDGVRIAIKAIQEGKLFACTSYMPGYEDGRAVCMLYDAITGAYYPPDEERMHAPISLVVCKDPNEIAALAQAASFKIPFTVVSAEDVMAKVFTPTKLPWDWTRISRGKAKELGLEYDLYGGFEWGGVKTINHLFGSAENYSRYIYDALARFADFKASTIAEANAPPYAPTADSPNVNPYQQWITA
jgi:ABC-type sugar transport system substrate-binding protein